MGPILFRFLPLQQDPLQSLWAHCLLAAAGLLQSQDPYISHCTHWLLPNLP